MLVSSGGVGQLSKSRTEPAWFFVQRKIEPSKALSVNAQKMKLDKLSCWKKKHMPANSLWPFKRMVKWPFEMVKWPPIGGWKGHIASPGDGNHEISSHWWGLEIQKTLRFLGLKKLFILSWPLVSKSQQKSYQILVSETWWWIPSHGSHRSRKKSPTKNPFKAGVSPTQPPLRNRRPDDQGLWKPIGFP